MKKVLCSPLFVFFVGLIAVGVAGNLIVNAKVADAPPPAATEPAPTVSVQIHELIPGVFAVVAVSSSGSVSLALLDERGEP